MKKKLLLILSIITLCTFNLLPEVHSQQIHRHLMANYHQFGGNAQQAQKWYENLDERESKFAYTGFIPFLQSLGQYREIVRLIPELDTAFKHNQDIQLIFVNALERVGNVQAAHERLIALNNTFSTNQEIAFRVAELYASRKEPENAIRVIDTLLNRSSKKPNNFIFHFLKAQIYVQMNEKDKAITTLKECLDTYPRFDKGWLLYAMLQEQAGHILDALKGYTGFLDTALQKRPEIEEHVVQLALKLSGQQKSNGIKTPHLEQAIAHFKQKEYHRAAHYLHMHQTDHPQDTQSRLLSIELLVTQKKYQEAITTLIHLIEKDTSDLWIETLGLLGDKVPYQMLLHAFTSLNKKMGKHLTFQLHFADFLLRHEKYKEAPEILQSALNLTQNIELKTKILFQMGICYYQEKKYTKARDVLEKAAHLGTQFPARDNLLAYYWATKGKNLERAQTFLDKALAKEPDNPHFIDTQALIAYKNKKYDYALELLKKIEAQCYNDCNVSIHLAKVHRKKGNVDQALQTLAQAEQHISSDQEKITVRTLQKKWKNT